MQLAVQEDLLPGGVSEKFERARALGLAGIEFWAQGLTDRVPAIAGAMERTGVRAAAVHLGLNAHLLHPDRDEREAALARLRQAVADAVDIGAAGVVFIPQPSGPRLPDLSPYRARAELEADLLYTHLRTLSDFAEALGVDLFIAPVNRYESGFINRLEQGAAVTRRINHARVKLAADLFHMALEEASLLAALREHLPSIGHLYLVDTNRRLPGAGLIDFAVIAEALRTAGYRGWCTLSCGSPSANSLDTAAIAAALPASLDMLRRAGWGD